MGGGSCENVKKVVKNIFFYAEGDIVVDEDENANEEHIFFTKCRVSRVCLGLLLLKVDFATTSSST